MTELTQQELKKLFQYDPATGNFTVLKAHPNSKRKVGSIGGWLTTQRYWALNINRRTYLAHRLAWLYMTGAWPKNTIDHIDGDKSNNKWHNLRDVTHQVNCVNSPRSRTPERNIYWSAGRNKWVVQTWKKGKAVFIGRYATYKEALVLRDKNER